MKRSAYIIQDHVISYNAWRQSLHKEGPHPKNKDGTCMNVVESYHYWLSEVDKTKWIKYAQRMRNSKRLIL